MKFYHIITYSRNEKNNSIINEFYTSSAAKAKHTYLREIYRLFPSSEINFSSQPFTLRTLGDDEIIYGRDCGPSPRYVSCERMGAVSHLKLMWKYHSQMTKIK